MTTLQKDAIEKLKAGVRGSVLQSGDEGYDEARTIWNAMIDRKPALIVRCAGAADVMRAVSFGRDHNLLVSVRGAGHNIAGNAVCDGGLMIDLSPMKSVHIDAKARRAFVGPGATLRDFDDEAQAFGLATPLGINSTTGISGLTLGGGFGWLTRKHGLTVDNLVSADVVTADGKSRRASANENADLFWALRGGGGNFGVVTRFEFQLHPLEHDVLSGLVVFPFSDAKSVLTKYRAFVATAPNDLSVWVVVRKAPPLPFLPESVHGKEIVAMAIFYAGKPEDGQRWIEGVRGLGKPLGEHVGAQPYTAWQQAFDPLLTPGARNYWKSHNFRELKDGVFEATIDYAGRLPSPHCEIFIGQLGGRAAEVPADAMAYGNRDANFVMNVHGRWETPEEDERCIAWSRQFFDAAAPFATGGVYVNFMTGDEANRVKSAFGPNYARLVKAKKTYDPGNLFRMNQNISPSGGT